MMYRKLKIYRTNPDSYLVVVPGDDNWREPGIHSLQVVRVFEEVEKAKNFVDTHTAKNQGIWVVVEKNPVARIYEELEMEEENVKEHIREAGGDNAYWRGCIDQIDRIRESIDEMLQPE